MRSIASEAMNAPAPIGCLLPVPGEDETARGLGMVCYGVEMLICMRGGGGGVRRPATREEGRRKDRKKKINKQTNRTATKTKTKRREEKRRE